MVQAAQGLDKGASGALEFSVWAASSQGPLTEEDTCSRSGADSQGTILIVGDTASQACHPPDKPAVPASSTEPSPLGLVYRLSQDVT